MKKKLLLSLLVLGFPLLVVAQDTTTDTKAPGQALPGQKVFFKPTTKSPFVSKEEATKIEAAKKAEEKRKQDELLAQIAAAKKAAEDAQRKQILCDEIKRHPSRMVSGNIRVDGIMGKEAIVNGSVVSRGKKIGVTLADIKEKGKEMKVKDIEDCGFNTKDLKIKVVSITDDSVWFVFKGERFQKKLPLL